jgi:hypothetical protein
MGLGFVVCPRCNCGRASADTSRGVLEVSCPDCQKTFIAKIIEIY